MSKISSNQVVPNWNEQSSTQTDTHDQTADKISSGKIRQQELAQPSDTVGIVDDKKASTTQSHSSISNVPNSFNQISPNTKTLTSDAQTSSELVASDKPIAVLPKVPDLTKPQTPDGDKTIQQLETLIEKSIQGLNNDQIADRLESVSQSKSTAAAAETWQAISNNESDKAKLLQMSQWNARLSSFTGAIVSVGVASVATAATNGNALPMLICASAALATASMNLVDQASQDSGGQSFSLNQILTQHASSMLETAGISKNYASSWGNLIGGAAGIVSGAVIIDSKLAGKTAKGLSQISGYEISSNTENLISQAAGISVSLAMFGLTRPLANWAASAGQAAVTANQLGKVLKTASQVGQLVYGQAARHFKNIDENNSNLDSSSIQSSISTPLPMPTSTPASTSSTLKAAFDQTYSDMSKVFSLIESGRQSVMNLFEQKTEINRHISSTNQSSNLIA